ncbi:hypothetical protein A1O1_03766 [Capronia coronata CBS 617.96]|uniref:Uncharacterized protein n=1 Tax=Capronia coronata CBS 617.96 TaxID=1182541 RepID=W9YCQ2_9EURO|nr:uncharacterized protein A1O1_03766 [Capronia coronata CBS 617.96]EXJ90662.1 hypothetical protein A1O1_03766 [Capronia coronata CBS 617.96]
MASNGTIDPALLALNYADDANQTQTVNAATTVEAEPSDTTPAVSGSVQPDNEEPVLPASTGNDPAMPVNTQSPPSLSNNAATSMEDQIYEILRREDNNMAARLMASDEYQEYMYGRVDGGATNTSASNTYTYANPTGFVAGASSLAGQDSVPFSAPVGQSGLAGVLAPVAANPGTYAVPAAVPAAGSSASGVGSASGIPRYPSGLAIPAGAFPSPAVGPGSVAAGSVASGPVAPGPGPGPGLFAPGSGPVVARRSGTRGPGARGAGSSRGSGAPRRQNAPIPPAPAAAGFQRRIPSILDHPDPFACPVCYHCCCAPGSVKTHLLEKHPELRLTKKTLEDDPRYAVVRPLSYYRNQGLDVAYHGNDRKQVNARRRMDAGMKTNDAGYMDNVYKETPNERRLKREQEARDAEEEEEDDDVVEEEDGGEEEGDDDVVAEEE